MSFCWILVIKVAGHSETLELMSWKIHTLVVRERERKKTREIIVVDGPSLGCYKRCCCLYARARRKWCRSSLRDDSLSYVLDRTINSPRESSAALYIPSSRFLPEKRRNSPIRWVILRRKRRMPWRSARGKFVCCCCCFFFGLRVFAWEMSGYRSLHNVR